MFPVTTLVILYFVQSPLGPACIFSGEEEERSTHVAGLEGGLRVGTSGTEPHGSWRTKKIVKPYETYFLKILKEIS